MLPRLGFEPDLPPPAIEINPSELVEGHQYRMRTTNGAEYSLSVAKVPEQAGGAVFGDMSMSFEAGGKRVHRSLGRVGLTETMVNNQPQVRVTDYMGGVRGIDTVLRPVIWFEEIA